MNYTFHIEVYRYHCIVGEYDADTMEELQQIVVNDMDTDNKI